MPSHLPEFYAWFARFLAADAGGRPAEPGEVRARRRRILAWPGRYSRKLGRQLPIATEGRDDGGTDYYMAPEIAALFHQG